MDCTLSNCFQLFFYSPVHIILYGTSWSIIKMLLAKKRWQLYGFFFFFWQYVRLCNFAKEQCFNKEALAVTWTKTSMEPFFPWQARIWLVEEQDRSTYIHIYFCFDAVKMEIMDLYVQPVGEMYFFLKPRWISSFSKGCYLWLLDFAMLWRHWNCLYRSATTAFQFHK